jgi:hypothetical protein
VPLLITSAMQEWFLQCYSHINLTGPTLNRLKRKLAYMIASSVSGRLLVICPSCCRLFSPRSPSRARGASTPMTGVPALYVWTSRRRCCVAAVLIGGTRRRSYKLRSASSSLTCDYFGASCPNSTSAALRV